MPYQIIVLIKQMPDLELVKPDPSTGVPNVKSVPLRFETLSKHAAEAAVRLKEKYGGKVTGICLGTETAGQAMKEAFAMGVDEGVVITGYQGNNPRFTAGVLAEKIKTIPHDVVLMGNQSADSYTGMLPGMLSAMLGEPLLGNALSVELSDGSAEVLRVMEDRNEKIRGKLPAVISVTQEINEPRLPPVMQILAAGKKPMKMEKAQPGNSFSVVRSNKAPKSERKKQIYEDPSKGIPEVVKAIKEAIR
jgi:electron transfer flavoprotein beta subunit